MGYQSEAHAANDNSPSTPDLTINKPAGTVEGDVMVCVILMANTVDPITIPLGWTYMASAGDPGSQLKMYYKIAGASEGSSYTWSWSTGHSSMGMIGRWDGVSLDPNPFATGSSNFNSSASPQNLALPSDAAQVTNETLIYGVGGVSTVFNLTSIDVTGPGQPVQRAVFERLSGNNNLYDAKLELWDEPGFTGAVPSRTFSMAWNPSGGSQTMRGIALRSFSFLRGVGSDRWAWTGPIYSTSDGSGGILYNHPGIPYNQLNVLYNGATEPEGAGSWQEVTI